VNFIYLFQKCLTSGPRGRHFLGPILRHLRACGRDKKTPAKRIVEWTISYTSKEIDSPPEEEEEDDSEPSEAESDESEAESPLSIRRFFLPRAGVVILEESSGSDDEGRRFV